MPQTLLKQPAESRLYDMDMSPRMATGEVITSVTSVTEKTVDPDTGARTVSSDLTFGTATFSGQLAQVRISVGLPNVLYEVTFIVETDAGNTLEGEGYLCVEDT